MKYRGFELDRFQAEAIGHIQRGSSVLVSAPTGTGKTLIADYLIEEIMERGGDVIYTAPIKALSNQKFRQYSKVFGRDKVGLVTGDIVINRDAPLKIMTTEILRNMLLHGSDAIDAYVSDDERAEFWDTAPASDTSLPEIERLEAVIVDEIHFVDDPERGTVWEEMLIYLPTDVRILGLSATLSNLDDFANWLSLIRESKVEVVKETHRAVPLEIFLANRNEGVQGPEDYRKAYKKWRKEQQSDDGGRDRGRGGRNRGRGGRGRDSREPRTGHVDVFERLSNEDLPALYFIYSRKLTETLAFELSRSEVGTRIGRAADREKIDVFLDTFEERYPTIMNRGLRRLLERGIAFHHAGLHVGLKALVEELYEARLIKVLYCTSTFALGINMPARTVVFDSLTKFNGVEVVELTVREFMQMAGRAGRRGIDTEGQVVVRMDFRDYPEVQALVPVLLSGKSEPVSSSFNLSFNSVVNLLDRYTEKQIETVLSKSFKAYQLTKEARRLEQQVLGMSAEKGDKNRKQRRKKASIERQLAESKRPLLWEQFQRKVTFLRSFGYITAENELRSPARILQRIQFEEVLVTELILNGVFEHCTPAQTFGVMCGLVQNLPRTARVERPADDSPWWDIFPRIDEVWSSEVVVNAQLVVGQEYTFTPELMPLGERWVKGDTLTQLVGMISNPTDLSGDLVGAFRRAKDLVGQLRNVYDDDPVQRKDLTQVLRKVSRDEVEVID